MKVLMAHMATLPVTLLFGIKEAAGWSGNSVDTNLVATGND
jgi:hypothetical protein